MALTLAESADLCQNKLVKGIYQELINEIPLFRKLPFIEVVGNAYQYTREDPSNMGSVGFKQVGGIWTESSASFISCTANLYVLGEDCDVPNLIQATRSTPNDQMAAQVKVKTKLMGNKFEEQAYYGVAATSSGFDGLHTIAASLPAARQLTMASNATGAALSCSKLDELCDVIKTGRPDILLMSRQTRRNLTKYLREKGSSMTTREEYGRLWEYWNDEVPIVVSDVLLDTELCDSNGQFVSATGGYTSSIFAIKFGEANGLVGLQSGGIQTETWDRLEQKDACRTRIKWYVGMALHSTLSLARLCNITNVTATA